MFQTPDFEENNCANEFPIVTRMLCAITIGVLSLGLMAVLILTDSSSSSLPVSLPTIVQEKLAQSGAENPVTAVLLNFRSYDTLLEIGVLLIVAVAILPRSGALSDSPLVSVVSHAQANPMLEGVLRWLVPMIIVMAGYMLWTGASLPGGAFQSGALLAGAGVLAQLSGRVQFCFTSATAKLLLTIGLITFMGVAVGVATKTGIILQYPTELAGPLILLIESAATLSIAAILLLLYNSLATQTAGISSQPSALADQTAASNASSTDNKTLPSSTREPAP